MNNNSSSLLGKRKRSPDNNGNRRNTKRIKLNKHISFNNNPTIQEYNFSLTSNKLGMRKASTTRKAPKREALKTEENVKKYLNRSKRSAIVAHEYAKIMNRLDLSNENKIADIKKIVDHINAEGYNTDINLLLKSYIYTKYYNILTPFQREIYKHYYKREEGRLKKK